MDVEWNNNFYVKNVVHHPIETTILMTVDGNPSASRQELKPGKVSVGWLPYRGKIGGSTMSIHFLKKMFRVPGATKKHI